MRSPSRFGYDSPRTWWWAAWTAWLEQQANDYLTAGQLGEPAATRLASLLGRNHPQAIAAAVVQVSTLQQREAWAAAAPLVSQVWTGHATRLGLDEPSDLARVTRPDVLRRARFDRDRDADGLSDLVEEILGTPAGRPAGPLDIIAGRPARSLALALSPGFLVAHAHGVQPRLEGFFRGPDAPRGDGERHPLSSVQRGFAERYGWLLVLDVSPGACEVALDTGTPPRRLRVNVSSVEGGWNVESGGVAERAGPGASLLVAADYDPATRRIFWWTSARRTWTPPFDSVPASGAAPYGLRLLPGAGTDGCRSVTWTLRRAEVAPK